MPPPGKGHLAKKVHAIFILLLINFVFIFKRQAIIKKTDDLKMAPQQETIYENEVEDEIKEPSLYKVLLHNDDYTTMDFVVEILEQIFHKSPAEAVNIMLHVHNNGIGIAGVYTREIAEEKVNSVHRAAEGAGFPLKASIEPEH